MIHFISKLIQRARTQSQSGQSSVEFLIVISVFLFLVLFHVTLSVTFMGSSFIEYAVFMAGRSAVSSYATIPASSTDTGGPRGRFKAVLASFLRTDGVADADSLNPQDTFIYPFVKLRADLTGGAEFVMDDVGFRDPEQGAPNVGEGTYRTYRGRLEFDQFFFVGSSMLPVGDFFTLKQMAIPHYFRREVSGQDCLEDLQDLDSSWPGLSTTELGGALSDNGC